MSSKKKTTKKAGSKKKKNKGGDVILRCVDIHLDKKKVKDRKAASLIIKYETASGTWTSKKKFDEIWKFIEAHCKQHKKIVKNIAVNSSKYKNDFLNKNDNKSAFKLITDVINITGKNKKALLSDSKIIPFIGAKRDFESDIKNSKKIVIKKDNNNTKKKDNKKDDKKDPQTKTSVSSNTFMSDLNGINNNPDDIVDADIPDDNVSSAGDDYKQQIISLKQELEKQKRKHLADISSLKQENQNLQANNAVLKDTFAALQETRNELEERVLKYEAELGKNDISSDMQSVFASDLRSDVDDPAEKYWKQTKEQKKTIASLELSIKNLTVENGDLKLKLERAKYVADHLTNDIISYTKEDYIQLENDYKEVELELDELLELNKSYELKMKDTAELLDKLELDIAKMKPSYVEYPNLINTIQEQQDKIEKLLNDIKKINAERDEFEDKYLKLREANKDKISKKEHEKILKSLREQIKEIEIKKNEIEKEKENILNEMEKIKLEFANLKIRVGYLEKENEKLLLGGGKDINLNLDFDPKIDFSLFKKDDFDFPNDISRNDLIILFKHFKLLIKEINDEFINEINKLSQRNDLLENYIELKGLPGPVGQLDIYDITLNNLPHPLPSMNFNDDLDQYNPTKQQLRDYINLMFNEWRRDEYDLSQMILCTNDDIKLLNDLDTCNDMDDMDDDKAPPAAAVDNDALLKLKAQLEEQYLKAEENSLEYDKKFNKQKELINELEKQLQTERQKNRNKVTDDDAAQPKTGKIGDDNGTDVDDNGIPASPSIVSDIVSDDGTGSINSKADDDDDDDDDLDNSNLSSIQKLRNQLVDQEEFIKELTDNMKQLEFETTQQKQILEREYQHNIELLNIDINESKLQIDDLLRQIGSDDLNILVNDFRNELWEARDDNNKLKKNHIKEIRQLERDRDELLREINLLRIKTDRMDSNNDQIINQIQNELDKKEKELQHFMQVSSHLAELRDQMDQLRADREQLQIAYDRLVNDKNAEKQQYLNEINEYITKNKKLHIRIKTAEQDIKSIKANNPNNYITQTEINKLREELNDLYMEKQDAINSKVRLIQSSSLEMERLRDEIKLLTGDRGISLRDIQPNRYHSAQYQYIRNSITSSISNINGSNAPIMNTHQSVLSSDKQQSYIGNAWTYTVSMLSSIGNIFNKDDDQNNPSSMNMNNYTHHLNYNSNEYDIYTDYGHSRSASIISNGNNNNNNGVYGGYNNNNKLSKQSLQRHATAPYNPHNHHHNNNHSRRQQSMAGSYAGNEMHHSRGLSAAAIKQKKRNQQRMSSSHMHRDRDHRHYKKQSSSYNNNQDRYNNHNRNGSSSMHHNNHNNHNRHGSYSQHHNHSRRQSRHRTYSNMSSQSITGKHRPKQLTQQSLMDGTDNENIRDSMAKIFDTFDAFDNAMDGLDDNTMDNNQIDNNNKQTNIINKPNVNIHRRQSSTYHSDYMRAPLTINEDDDDDDDDDVVVVDDNNNNHNIDLIQNDNDDDDDELLANYNNNNSVNDDDNDDNNNNNNLNNNNNDDFWNENIIQDDINDDDDDDDGVNNNYYDDDNNFGMNDMDYTGNAGLPQL